MSSPVLHYVTYFERHYLPRGIALYHSLERHSPPFVLWVLCLDEDTHAVLSHLRLPHMRLVRLQTLEAADPELLAVKQERLPIEYYWTCGPAFLWHLLARHGEIDVLAYVDSDLFFFESPQPIFDELERGSIYVHRSRSVRTPDDPRVQAQFNVGLVGFRRTENGLACARRWREQCIEWCFDRFEPGRFGDQGYLGEWPALYADLVIGQHPGAGVAPWNVNQMGLEIRAGRLAVDGEPLLFYHFSKVRRVRSWLYELHDWRFHRQSPTSVVRRGIYAPYVRALRAAERRVRAAGGRIPPDAVGRDPETESERRRLARSGELPWPWRLRRFMIVLGPLTI